MADLPNIGPVDPILAPKEPTQKKSKAKIAIIAVLAVALIGTATYIFAGGGLFKGFIGEELAQLEECVEGVPQDIAVNSNYPLTIKEGCNVQFSSDETKAKFLFARLNAQVNEANGSIILNAESNIDNPTYAWYLDDEGYGGGNELLHMFFESGSIEVRLVASGDVGGQNVEMERFETVSWEEPVGEPEPEPEPEPVDCENMCFMDEQDMEECTNELSQSACNQIEEDCYNACLQDGVQMSAPGVVELIQAETPKDVLPEQEVVDLIQVEAKPEAPLEQEVVELIQVEAQPEAPLEQDVVEVIQVEAQPEPEVVEIELIQQEDPGIEVVEMIEEIGPGVDPLDDPIKQAPAVDIVVPDHVAQPPGGAKDAPIDFQPGALGLSVLSADTFHNSVNSNTPWRENSFIAYPADSIVLVTFSQAAENVAHIRFNNKQWDLDVGSIDDSGSGAGSDCEVSAAVEFQSLVDKVLDGGNISDELDPTVLSKINEVFDSAKSLVPFFQDVISKEMEILEEAKVLLTAEHSDKVVDNLKQIIESVTDEEIGEDELEEVDEFIAMADSYLDMVLDYSAQASSLLDGEYVENDEDHEDAKFFKEEFSKAMSFDLNELLNYTFLEFEVGMDYDSLQNAECQEAFKNLTILEILDNGKTKLDIDYSNVPDSCLSFTVGNANSNNVWMEETSACGYLPESLVIAHDGEFIEIADMAVDAVDQILADKGFVEDVLNKIFGFLKEFEEDEDKNFCIAAGNLLETIEYLHGTYTEGGKLPPYYLQYLNTDVNEPLVLEYPFEDSGVAKDIEPVFLGFAGEISGNTDDSYTYTPNEDYEGWDAIVHAIELDPAKNDSKVGKIKVFEGIQEMAGDFVPADMLAEIENTSAPATISLTCIDVGAVEEVKVEEVKVEEVKVEEVKVEEAKVEEVKVEEEVVEEVAATVEVEVPVTVINNITNTTIVQAPEVIQRQCSDGKNNDDDSFIDFPADPGCENADDDTEDPNPVTRITTECSDGIDNDGNGFTDYPEDQGCTNENDNTESPALETIISVETVEQSLEEAIISANNCLVKTSKDKSVTLADLEEDDPAQEMLNALTNIAYGEDPIIVGRLIDGEYHFEGDKPILRPEFFKLAAWPSCLEQSAESQGIWSTGEAKEFKDPGFDEDFWAFEIINGLAQLDVVSGYEDGTVGLDKQITRAEIVKLLLDAFALRTYLDEHGSLDLADYDKNAIFKEVFADSLSEYEENPFTDVSNLNKPWYYNYSIVAYDKKITQGIEGMFKGDEPATRLEAATMIYNFFMVNVEEQVTEEVVEEVKEITFVRTFIPARYGSF